MSIALEFESKLLQLLNEKNTSNTVHKIDDIANINRKTSIESKPVRLSNVYKDSATNLPCIIPPTFTLFLGICIGVGLASHALIIQWK